MVYTKKLNIQCLRLLYCVQNIFKRKRTKPTDSSWQRKRERESEKGNRFVSTTQTNKQSPKTRAQNVTIVLFLLLFRLTNICVHKQTHTHIHIHIYICVMKIVPTCSNIHAETMRWWEKGQQRHTHTLAPFLPTFQAKYIDKQGNRRRQRNVIAWQVSTVCGYTKRALRGRSNSNPSNLPALPVAAWAVHERVQRAVTLIHTHTQKWNTVHTQHVSPALSILLDTLGRLAERFALRCVHLLSPGHPVYNPLSIASAGR